MRRIIRLLVFALLPLFTLAARTFQFKVPLTDLQDWAEKIVIRIEKAEIMGHSGVHLAAKDCEMHFGASIAAYQGDPKGWVFEPMNICKQPFFGKEKYSKKDWLNYAADLVQKTVSVEGVPRIWPEHLTGVEEESNPNHALELHPLVRLQAGGGEANDFTEFIFAIPEFAGISEMTATSILRTTTASTRKAGNIVTVNMKSNAIGNFATLDVIIDPSKIVEAPGGHRMMGEAQAEGEEPFQVRMVSIAGTEIDKKIASMTGRTRRRRLPVLVLFSLSPVALLDTVKSGAGGTVKVPIQLILFGETE